MGIHLRWFIISYRRRSFITNLLLAILILWSIHVFIRYITNITSLATTPTPSSTTPNILLRNKRVVLQKFYNDSEYRKQVFEKRIKRLSQVVTKSRTVAFNNKSISFPYYNVHIFYYAWYGNIKFDNDFHHWNHQYIPSWKKEHKVKIFRKHHEAPLDIGSNYYPSLGCYSSRDPNVIQTHMWQMKFAGVGVVVISWTPPRMKDSPHDILPSLFYYASENNIKLTLHVEPYFNRNPANMVKHLIDFFDSYINHPALYKINITSSTRPTRSLPVIYVYDSYLTPFTAWKELLSTKGNISIRGTKYDAVFIGLLVDVQHRYHIKKSHFDGFYTYFASNGFSYGSTWKNWNSLAKFASQNQLIFVPSVGPGYIDTQVRPWNSVNTRHRRHGQYYDVAWRSAISSRVRYISITSFNEWHEGTQIEPTQPRSVTGFTYLDYSPEGSDLYLNLTKYWVGQFYHSREKH